MSFIEHDVALLGDRLGTDADLNLAFENYRAVAEGNPHLTDVWTTKAKTHCEGLRCYAFAWIVKHGDEYDVDDDIIEAAGVLYESC